MTNGYAEGDVTKRTSAVVPLDFWTDHVTDPTTNAVTPIDYVRWARAGSNGATTEDKVDRIKKHNPIVWQSIKGAFDAWKSGQEEPIEGTALEAWPGVTKGQISTLRNMHIRTVEALADANDAAMERIGMGGRALVDRARKFVEVRNSGAAAMASKTAQLEASNKMLSDRLAELEELLTASRRAKEDPKK